MITPSVQVALEPPDNRPLEHDMVTVVLDTIVWPSSPVTLEDEGSVHVSVGGCCQGGFKTINRNTRGHARGQNRDCVERIPLNLCSV